eukprot:2256140-Rhodomonas_salina.1
MMLKCQDPISQRSEEIGVREANIRGARRARARRMEPRDESEARKMRHKISIAKWVERGAERGAKSKKRTAHTTSNLVVVVVAVLVLIMAGLLGSC